MTKTTAVTLAILSALLTAGCDASGGTQRTPGRTPGQKVVVEREFKPPKYSSKKVRSCVSRSKGKCVSWQSRTLAVRKPPYWELDLADGTEIKIYHGTDGREITKDYQGYPLGSTYPN